MQNQIDESSQIGEHDVKSEGSDGKIVRTRRTRSVTEGRDWICRFCKRAYLSIGSVVYHVRLKHMHEAKAMEFITSLLKSPRKPKQEATETDPEAKASQQSALEESKEQVIEHDELLEMPSI